MEHVGGSCPFMEFPFMVKTSVKVLGSSILTIGISSIY